LISSMLAAAAMPPAIGTTKEAATRPSSMRRERQMKEASADFDMKASSVDE
jgi:hypothetical protein